MPENHIVIDDEKASRSHARIVQQNHEFFLEDQESENGTHLNGMPVKKAKLCVGDQILIGSHILEVISADDTIQSVTREDQIDLATDEEWRLDDTVSIDSNQYKEGFEEASKINKAELPKLHMTLRLGNEIIMKDVIFDKGKKLPEGSTPDTVMFIALKIGRWVLEKKIPLK